MSERERVGRVERERERENKGDTRQLGQNAIMGGDLGLRRVSGAYLKHLDVRSCDRPRRVVSGVETDAHLHVQGLRGGKKNAIIPTLDYCRRSTCPFTAK